MIRVRVIPILMAVSVACAAPDGRELEVDNARAPSPPANVMAVYLTIRNPGPAADTLLSGSAPGFSPLEVHETTSVNGMMAMR